MKKILFLLLTAISIGATAQQVVSTTVKFNNNVTFNDSTFGNLSKVPVTTFEDTVRITRGAANGKVLASDANGNAYWTNVVLVDTFSGTPVFPSGLKADTIFTTDFNGTGYVMQLVNDTTGLFKPMVFSNGLTKTGDSIKLGGTSINNTTIQTDTFEFTVNNNTSYNLHVSDNLNGLGTPFAGSRYLDTTNNVLLFTGVINAGDPASTLHAFNLTTGQESEVSISYFNGLGKQGILLKSNGNTISDMVGMGIVDEVTVYCPNESADTIGFQIMSWDGSDTVFKAGFYRDGTLQIKDGTQGSGKTLTSDANGIGVWSGDDGNFVIDSVATTGDTVALTLNSFTAIIASGAITDLVLRFPASPSNGDVVVAKFDFAVTTLTSDGQGKTIYGFPSSTALGQHREWRYDATTGAWY